MLGTTIWLIVQGILFFYAQILVVPALGLGNLIPNILLPWLVYNLWKKPFTIVVPVSFFIALMHDMTSPLLFGMHALIFMLICIGIDLFRIPFEHTSVVARVLAIVLCNIFYVLFSALVHGLVSGFAPEASITYLLIFLVNIAFSFAIFWSMEFLSRLKIVVSDE